MALRRYLEEDQPGYPRTLTGIRLNRDPQPSAGVVNSQSLKSTAVGAEERGYDGGKKVKCLEEASHHGGCRRFRALKAKVHNAKAGWTLRGDQDAAGPSGQATISSPASVVVGRRLPRGEDKGKDWVEKTLGWSMDLVERPKKPAPKEVLMSWIVAEDAPYAQVDTFKYSDGSGAGAGKGFRYRAIVLENVKGEQVTIGIGSKASEFDEFAPEAQKVLDTVKWGDS
jgi:hypothetical protein